MLVLEDKDTLMIKQHIDLLWSFAAVDGAIGCRGRVNRSVKRIILAFGIFAFLSYILCFFSEDNARVDPSFLLAAPQKVCQ